MSLEWLWRFSKLSPNSPQTRSKLKGFHFFYFTFYFFGKEEWVLERVWRVSKTLSKLSPNPLQTHAFFFGYLCHIMSQPKKLLVQEALQSSASSACSTVYELLETSPPRVTPEKNRNFRLWVGKGLIDHRRLVDPRVVRLLWKSKGIWICYGTCKMYMHMLFYRPPKSWVLPVATFWYFWGEPRKTWHACTHMQVVPRMDPCKLTLYTHPLHSTLHSLHFTLYTPYSTLLTPHSTLYTPHSILYTFHFTLHTLHFTLHTPHSILCTLHFTLYTPHPTLYTLHTLHSPLHTFTLLTPHFTLNSPHFALHSPHFYTLHSTLYIHFALHTPHFSTFHFTLQTLHSTLYTWHPTLYTLHSTLHTPHFTLYTGHSSLHTLHSSLHTPHFTLYTPHSTLYTPHFTLHTPHSTLYTLHFTLYTTHSALHTLHFTHSTLLTPHFTLHTLHSTLYTFQSTLQTGNREICTRLFKINCCRKKCSAWVQIHVFRHLYH